MADFVIEKEISGSKGRYVIRTDGEEAELTFSITTPTLIIADHTGVPDSFRGTGAGLALVTHLVQDARENGFKVMPLCPFVNAMRKRHPEWADVFSV
ncbi:GNAT family N-acetyltransferase [Neotabrizicola shimadae]|uniref:N-acetyltransferase n=1 Tax=Neotabrizicola shimadae TaxID=2807096 RepID=A0A8G1EES4_9RHOB|nr:GNAT family N-acetyltransferase [Neotabrizicola shimadae]QYZ71668.1 N-acetyltransferase [Neotabrizicola shimadae]